MSTPPIELAEKKLSELQARLAVLRPQVLDRWHARRLAPDDLERIMELDAEIERAAMNLKALQKALQPVSSSGLQRG
jgi:uncharacterized small protein (DUF1192 family)